MKYFSALHMLLWVLLVAALWIGARPDAWAQIQNVGIGTTAPNAKAALEIASTHKGLLIPRLDSAQRALINTPPQGLLVYQTNGRAGLWYYQGGAWQFLRPGTQADNLGNHTATQNLNLNGFRLNGGATNNVGVAAGTTLELGAGSIFKEINAGKIGYQAFSSGLDIVGAGLTQPTRRVKIWAEGGTEFVGNVGLGTATPTAPLDVAGGVRVRGLTVAGIVTTDAAGNLSSTAASTLADNLGNHTATQNLNLVTNALTGSGASIGPAVGMGIRADGGLNLGQNTVGNTISIGYQSGQANTTGNTNLFFGYQSGPANTTGSNNLFIGYQSGFRNTTGFTNYFSGYQSGYNNTQGQVNYFSGIQSGYSNSTGNFNQFIGAGSGYSNQTGTANQFIGYVSGLNNTTGNYNDFSGYNSGFANQTGSFNQFIGIYSGYRNTTGAWNLFVGDSAGLSNTTGNRNYAFGVLAGPTTSNLTNAGAIGYKAQVSQSNSLVLGGTGANAISVGIGTAAPSATLHVVGSARITSLTTAGIVTTDAAGNLASTAASTLTDNLGNHTATQNLNLNGFRISGGAGNNIGVVTGTTLELGAGLVGKEINAGKIGYQAFSLGLDIVGAGATQPTRRVKIWAEGGTEFVGNVGLGTATPTARLDVAGTVRLRGLTTAGVVTTDASGNLSSQPLTNVADNLGNHTATQRLNLQGNAITGNGASIGTAVGIGVRADGGLNIGQNTVGNNVFIGYQCGEANTSGYLNHFSGWQCGMNNQTGFLNFFLGPQAGLSNTTGIENFFMGPGAGYYNDSGSDNMFIGYQSGLSNQNGSGNLFIGLLSGNTNQTGSYNQFIGFAAGAQNLSGNHNQFYGLVSGRNNINGSRNLFVGDSAGFANVAGSRNWAFGMQAGPTSGNLTNAGAIGYNALVSQSNSLALGGTGAYAVNVGIGTPAPATTLDIEGALSVRANSSITITTDNQAVTVGNRSYLRLGSDITAAPNRTIILSSGLQTGQMLIISNASSALFGVTNGAFEIQENATVNTVATRQLGPGDTLTLIWDGAAWIEVGFANN